MLDFLEKADISKYDINEIDKKLNDFIKNDLSFIRENCLDIIKILKEIGINNEGIKSLLIYEVDLFFIDYDKFLKKLRKIDINKFINEINDGYIEESEIIFDIDID